MTSAVRFGQHTLYPQNRVLETGGQPVALGARAYDVLLALVERRDRVVSKSELLDVVWPGSVVEENNLQVHIHALRKVLGAGAIATIPGRGYQFVLPLESLPDAYPSSAAPSPATHGLFGRDDDLRAVRALATAHPVVTVVGPGGVGKTVLARALIDLEAGSGRDAAWVELAAVREGAQIAVAMSAALDVRLPAGDPMPALRSGLRARNALLVLDNAEHLVDAVGRLVSDLRAAAPQTAFVVTSQVPLGIHDERVFRVEPLACPPPAVTSEDVRGYPAIELFVARASAADRRFVLGADNADAVAAICRQLDGMPLAIELAAARVRELGVAILRDSLAERFRMIATRARTGPERHQSLHAALDWSHGLLDADDQAVFRRLGVFSNGFTLPLALAVAGDGVGDWATVDRLASLAERSLVAVNAEEPPRYSLAETMRAYALERLAASGELEKVRARHADALHAYFAATKVDSGNPQFPLVQRELDNARDAFAWARENAPAVAVGLATLAARFTVWSARRAEALSWLASCEPLVTDAIPRAMRAEWSLEFARFRLFNRHPAAKEAARRALALFREEADERGVVQALAALLRSHYEPTEETRAALVEMNAIAARHPDWPPSMRYIVAGTNAHASTCEEPIDYAKATRYRKEEATLAAAMGRVQMRNAAETNLIALLRAQAQYEATGAHAAALYDEVRERANALLVRLRGTNETANVAYASLHLLDALIATSRLGEARSCAIDAWQSCGTMNLPLAAAPVTLLTALSGRVRTAARLLGYTRAKFARLDFQMPDEDRAYIDRIERLVRERVDDGEMARLCAEGGPWTDDEAFRAAFDSSEP